MNNTTTGEWIVCGECMCETRAINIAICPLCDMRVHNAGKCAYAHQLRHIERGDACESCGGDVREFLCVLPSGRNACSACTRGALRVIGPRTSPAIIAGLINLVRSCALYDIDDGDAWHDDMHAMKRARSTLRTRVEDCAEAFIMQPDAHNYRALYDAMGLLQQINQEVTYADATRDAWVENEHTRPSV